MGHSVISVIDGPDCTDIGFTIIPCELRECNLTLIGNCRSLLCDEITAERKLCNIVFAISILQTSNPLLLDNNITLSPYGGKTAVLHEDVRRATIICETDPAK